ncbi:hypothetical protein BLNAU_18267 [Blattamonas nauphoetae]|uniref:Uncharacterized protein n=1 Tax=Blattamonas nauphoetae TaxID=2049346 RepID=A0ABQ9X659_9EUKA|nr:hypothetical protein BLNAU_18267 [Blattamonas nauphoetae]
MASTKQSVRLLRLLSLFLVLVYAAALVVGLAGLFQMTRFRIISLCVVFFGLLGMGVSYIGYWKKGFPVEPEKGNALGPWVSIYYLGGLLIHTSFMFLAVAAFSLRPTISYALTLSEEDLKHHFSGITAADIQKLPNYVETISAMMTIVGIYCLVVSLFQLGTVVLLSVNLGSTLFIKFFLTFGSVIMLLAGAAITLFLLMLNPWYITMGNVVILPESHYRFLIFFALALCGVGALGLLSVYLGEKHKILSVFYLVGTLIVYFGLLLYLITMFRHQATISDTITDLCHIPDGEEPKVKCSQLLEIYQDNMCKSVPEEGITDCKTKYAVQNVIDIYVEMATGWGNLLLWISLYLFVFLCIFTICLTMNIFRKRPELREGFRKLTQSDEDMDGDTSLISTV